MNSSSRIPEIGSVGPIAALIGIAVACTPTNKVTPGAPELVNFVVVDPSGASPPLKTDGGAVIPVPPLSTVFALFDRILDPTNLEAIDPDGGAITPKEGIASVTWSGGQIPAATVYIPNGHHELGIIPMAFGVPFGAGPSITIRPLQGLPSGAEVTVALDPDKVRSRDQKHGFVVRGEVTSPLVFQTEPLAVTIDVPVFMPPDGGAADDAGSGEDASNDGGLDDAGAPIGPPPPAPSDFVVHVTFNNLTADATAQAIRATAAVAGAPVEGLEPQVVRDAMSAAGWLVSPPTGGWPAGAVVTVTVGVDAVDNFQVALDAAVSATFSVAP